MRIDSNKTIWQVTYFKLVPVGASFKQDGNTWLKRSTRTAIMTKPERFAGKWFYFRGNERCEVALS